VNLSLFSVTSERYEKSASKSVNTCDQKGIPNVKNCDKFQRIVQAGTVVSQDTRAQHSRHVFVKTHHKAQARYSKHVNKLNN
jgi:hypothetical protein